MNGEVAGRSHVASGVLDRRRESRQHQIARPTEGDGGESDAGDWASRTTKWAAEVESGVEDRSLRLSREGKLQAKRGEERERSGK